MRRFYDRKGQIDKVEVKNINLMPKTNFRLESRELRCEDDICECNLCVSLVVTIREELRQRVSNCDTTSIHQPSSTIN